MTSVNTNYGALVALQSLNQTTRELASVQNRVNTGLKVATAKDNGAVFAIAEGQRARVASLGAVMDGIDRAASVIDVGLSAGEAIGDILKQLKEKSVAAQATDLSSDQRAALQADFDALRNQINQIANAATFNGSNLVNGTNLSGGASSFTVLTTDTGAGGASSNYTVSSRDNAGTDTSANSRLVNVNATLASIDSDYENADGLTFTVGSGANQVTYNVGFAANMTLQGFLDKVTTTTNGAISASYDASTGNVIYSSASDFTVAYNDNGGNAPTGSDLAFLIGDGAGDTGIIGATGSNQLAVSGFDFRLGIGGQALSTVTSALDISTSGGAASASTAIDTAITSLNRDLATLGAQSKALDVQKNFLGKLQDSIEAGIGNLVDADLAKESARLQALQVKQQLGAQALSIANSAPSIVLSFFR
ncbi:MAG: flagellin [Hyphomonadaceae bacterium]|nr:flagellin [Hyphomonadaceae bacterium]MBX3511242.1 flagellin [Hyphomonadaceae bacterium]